MSKALKYEPSPLEILGRQSLLTSPDIDSRPASSDGAIAGLAARYERLLESVVADADPVSSSRSLADCITSLPVRGTVQEFIIARAVATDALGLVAYAATRGVYQPAPLPMFTSMGTVSAADWTGMRVAAAEGMEACVALAQAACCRHGTRHLVLDASRIIADHYTSRRLTAAAAAAKLHVSVEHLSRVLKRYTGCGFVILLNRFRVRAAVRMMQAKSSAIKEIAYAVGYGGTAQLDRHFRRCLGITPSDYRRSLFQYRESRE